MSFKSSLRAYALLAFLLAGAGCVPRFDPDAMQLRADGDTAPVYGAYSAGQTFTAVRSGLSAVEVDWSAGSGLRGPLVLHLREQGSASDLRQAQIVSLPDGSPLVWRFTPLPDSAGRAYSIEIDAPRATESNPLKLRASYHDVYAPGTLLVDGEAAPGDLSFRTYYDYGLDTLGGDLANALAWLWLAVPALLLFWAPGYVLLQRVPYLRERFDSWERAALAVGLSLATFPVLLLWVTNVGAALSEWAARVLFGVIGVVVLVTLARNWRTATHTACNRQDVVAALVLAVVLALGLVVRLLAIRDLALPAWVDSVHHVLIARIVVETGQIPLTYQPYLDVQQATYHYGFQSLVAAFTWLTGESLPKATLLAGQFLNTAVALQVYLLTRWLTGRRLAPLLAAFIVALLSTMPAFYVNWGRYTELGGLLILAPAFVLCIEAARRRDWRVGALAVLAAAGLLATHYRVFAFFVCLVAAWWLVELAKQPRRWRARAVEAAFLAACLGLGMALLMPWIARVATDLWWRGLTEWNAGPAGAHADFGWEYVTYGFDRYLLALGALGALVALGKRQWFSAVLLVWLGMLFVITNPSLFGLPGEALFDNVSMLIVWFMPLAVCCGWLGDEMVARWLGGLSGAGRVAFYWVAGSGMVALSALGIYQQITMVRPNSLFALQADRDAIAWLAENTPPGSRFLINARPWDALLYAGTDGGYWITPLAGRQTTTPPALYGLGDAEHVMHVLELDRRIAASSGDPDALARLMRDEGVRYVYIGALGGELDPGALRASARFRTVYDNGRVTLFGLAALP